MPRLGLSLFAVVLILSPAAAQEKVARTDLKPGLVLTVTDPGPNPLTLSRVEPAVAVALAAGEAPHPRSVGGETFRWQGYVNVLQAGKYRFDAILIGKLTVRVGDKVVFDASGSAADPKDAKTVPGPEVELPAGFLPFSAEFTRSPKAAARVELVWRGPGFRPEPVPHQFLGHLPKQRPASLKDDLAREHGRLLFEEMSCIRCHRPGGSDAIAKTLADRTGPNLAEVGKRVHPGWLDAWLADPQKLRPNTTMPKMFADDEAGRAERYAVVAFLASRGGPVPAAKVVNAGEYQRSVGNGQRLYVTAGCAACHGDKLTQPPSRKPSGDEDEKPPLRPEDSVYAAGTASPQGFYLLGSVGSKTRPEVLAKYLENPLATNPHGRMPNMGLSGEEARDLARFLCRQSDDRINPEMPAEPKADPLKVAAGALQAIGARPDPLTKMAWQPRAKQWAAAGELVFAAKGCGTCHPSRPDGKPDQLVPFPDLAAVRTAADQGCLAEKPPAGVPAFPLTAPQRDAVRAFLKDGLSGPGRPAPAYHAARALKRFNCLNCHSRDGEGGFSPELADAMRLVEKAENADDVAPPRLTGVGHKLRSSWLKQVLVQGGRARPWMTLRMPQYGEANVGFLTDALAKLEGAVPDDAVGRANFSAAVVEAGRTLVGKNGHGCISCHDISGVPTGGTRGPDLATTNQRVRYDWYVRWMHQPQRLAPGTRMPQVATDGKALLTTVFGGDADRQFEAMWAYLSLGPGLPLPAGMEPPKGLTVIARDRPEVLRTFMPDGAGSKAVAVGFPQGVNFVFDAATCRLGYAWTGNFLDAAPVWTNRGGAPAKLLGPKFYAGPPGFPWALTDSRTPPDFLKRADDPAYGHPLPEDRLYAGPRHVQFGGYSLDAAGVPTFRYALSDDVGKLSVTETAEPLPVSVAAGLRRTFTVERPAGQTAWLLAGVAAKDPRGYLPGGGTALPDPKAEWSEIGAAGLRVVVPTDGGRATVLEAAAAPDRTAWQFVPVRGGKWLVLLRLPVPTAAAKADVTLLVWGLPRDDEELLKGLRAK